jgi:hypothetical protein
MRLRDVGKGELLEFVMLVAISVATMSALATAFYLRFLFALRKEWSQHGICYLVCLCSYSTEQASEDDPTIDASIPRAA